MARRIGLFVTFFSLPFGEAISLLHGTVSGSRIAGVVLVVTYLIHGVHLRGFDTGRYRITLPLMWLTLWAACGLVWCPASKWPDALMGVFRMIQIAVQLHIVYEFLKSRDDLRLIAIAYLIGIVGVAGSAAVGIAKWTADVDKTGGRLSLSIYGGAMNANDFAAHIMVGVLILMFVVMYGRGSRRIVALMVSPLLVWMLLASGSRGAVLGGLGGAVAVLLWPSPRARKNVIGVLSLLVTIALVAITALRLAAYVDESIVKRFDVEKVASDLREDRLALIEKGLRYVFLEGHWLGSGCAGGTLFVHSRDVNVVHCMPVQLATDFGVPTLAIFVFLFWRVFYVVHKAPPGNLRSFCQALTVFVFLASLQGIGYSPWIWLDLCVATSIAFMESQSMELSPKQIVSGHFAARV